MYEGSEVGGMCPLLCPRGLKQTGSQGSCSSQVLLLWLLDVDPLFKVACPGCRWVNSAVSNLQRGI